MSTAMCSNNRKGDHEEKVIKPFDYSYRSLLIFLILDEVNGYSHNISKKCGHLSSTPHETLTSDVNCTS